MSETTDNTLSLATCGYGAPKDWLGQTEIGSKGTVEMNPPANTGDARDGGSVPVLRRCPGGGNSNPLHYSLLDNPMDRGAW